MKKIAYDFTFLIGLIAPILFVYWPVHEFDYLIGWDDQWFVTNHYTENGFTWQNICLIFTDFYYGQYSPINQVYYTLLYSIEGYSPGHYHVASICIHYLNCILIYYLISGILRDIYKLDVINSKIVAFITVALFAVLPLNVEAVSWIAASKVLIYSLFYLASLICYRKYIKSKNPKMYYSTMICFLFSFGAKEQAVMLPLTLFLFDFLYGRKLTDKLALLEKVPILILSLLMGILTIDSQQIESRDFYSLIQRVPLFFFTITEYFTKTIFPVNLSYLYPFPFQKGEAVPTWMWIHTISLPLIFIILRKYFLNKLWILISLFFLFHIILVSNAFSLGRYSIIADRYAYLSSISICLGIALIFLKFSAKKYRTRFLVIFLGLSYFLFLIYTSSSYIPTWKNATTLKKRLAETIKSRPDIKN